MRSRKHRVCSLLVLLVLTVSLCACQSGPAATSTNAPKSATPVTTSSGTQTTAGPVSEEPIDIWYYMRGGSDTITMNEQNAVDAISAAVLEHFNANLTVEIVPKVSYEEKANIYFASGDYPDILLNDGISDFVDAVQAGILLPTTNIADYDPDWGTVDWQTYVSRYSYEGEYYAIPQGVEAFPNSIYYREDWLENLNLSVPTTPEELADVLRAFTTQDPDGNGKNDTYGIAVGSGWSQGEAFWQMFLPCNPNGNGFYVNEAGKIDNVWASCVEDIKIAAEYWRTLYAEGAMDPEFVTITQADYEAKFCTGVSGVWSKGSLFIMPRQAKVEANFPDGRIISFPAIKGKYGYNYKVSPTAPGMSLTNASKDHVDVGMKVLGYLCKPEAVMLVQLGVEGKDYTVENNEIKWAREEDAAKYNPGDVVRIKGLWQDAQLPAPVPLLDRNLEIALTNYDRIPVIQTANSTTYQDVGADIGKIAKETITKVIIGEEAVEAIDKAAQEIMSLQMATVLEELNSAK